MERGSGIGFRMDPPGPQKVFESFGAHDTGYFESWYRAFHSLHEGKTGVFASFPTTVVHGRTFHCVTNPCFT